MSRQFKVGIYARLSVDDANNSAKAKNYIPSEESASIENQKELLSKFVMLSGWIEVKSYCDDGYSGGNFNRPAFQEMLQDIKDGVINLVLVKDLSRLGRDYVEVGRYTDVVFPSLGCRFVALLDGIDTQKDSNEMLHFRSLMNDYHLKDLSNKIKSVKLAKVKNGEYLGSMCPYGYRKSPADKHKLIVDDYASTIVKRIFSYRAEGISYGKIVGILNTEGIMSPRAYWYQQQKRLSPNQNDIWSYATVKAILKNPIYVGIMKQNHTGSLSYKQKTMIRKPSNEWICHEGLHEPIITKEQWEKVQAINEKVRKSARNIATPRQHLFSGKLVCAGCGKTLSQSIQHKNQNGTEKDYISYYCTRYLHSGRTVCSWHRISEITLSKLVVADIRFYAEQITHNTNALLAELKQQLDESSNSYTKADAQEYTEIQKRIAKFEHKLAILYEDRYAKKISVDEFQKAIESNEENRQALLNRSEQLKQSLKSTEKNTLNFQEWNQRMKKYMNLETLDRNIVDELIDHIVISEKSVVDGKSTQDIKIFYNFVGELPIKQ